MLTFRYRYVALITTLLLVLLCGAALAEGYPESEHPYANDSDITWTYTHSEEAYALKVTFSGETELESGFDFLYVTGGDGVEQKFTGTDLKGETLYLQGSIFTIRLTSDSSVNKYGFTISEIVAVSQTEYEEYISTPHFTINSSGTITAYSGQVAELVIPDEIDGVKVTAIGDSVFQGNTYLTKVTIPENVTSIGSSAFRGCSGLTGTLTLPEGLTSIGNSAFYGCSGLTGTLTLPEGMTSIGGHAFYECSGLTGTLALPEGLTSIESLAFYGCSGLTGIDLPESLTNISSYAFYNCSGLSGTLTLPESMTSIGDGAFYSCSGLTGTLTLPEGLTSIGSYAFYSCSGLTGDLIIPDGVTVIGKYAFYKCEGLDGTLILPENLVEIGEYAFEGCSLNGVLELPEGLEKIGGYAFVGCYFTGDLKIPDTVTEIGEWAFWSCDFDGTLTLPAGLTEIKEGTFCWCDSLTGELVIPDGVTSIGSDAFAECWNFTGELDLPAGLTSLGESAFWRCKKITGTVVIPEGTTEIPEDCFYDCLRLEGVQLSESMVSIGTGAFENCKALRSVRIYPAVTSIDAAAFTDAPNVVLYVNSGSPAEVLAIENGWKYILVDGYTMQPSDMPALYIGWDESFSVRDGNGNAVEDVIWSGSAPEIASVTDEGIVIGLAEGNVTITATISDGISLSRDYVVKAGADESYFKYSVFNGEATITGYTGEEKLLVIPPALGGYPVTALEANAFRFANCQRVYIPACVEEIGDYAYGGAFNRCFSLKEFRVAEGSIFYTIDGVLFGGERYISGHGWTNAIMVQYPYGRIETSYTVPDGILVLWGEAFEACDLKHIELPDSLVEINYNALSLSDIESLCIPSSVRYIRGSALGSMYNVEEIGVAEDNPYFVSVDGVVYSRDMKTLVAYPSGKPGDSYVIPDGVTTVGYGACESAQFKYVSLPDTLTTIDWDGFNGASLRELWLPDSLVEIDGWAFAYTDVLSKVVIPESVQSIGGNAFMAAGRILEYYEGDHTRFYFKHSPDDAIAIEDEYTFPETSVIYALPGGDVQAFAEQTGVNFASLADLEVAVPQLPYEGETVEPALTAGGYEITLPVEWASSDGDVLAAADDVLTAVSNGSVTVTGRVPELGLQASAPVVVRGGNRIVLPEDMREVSEEAFAGSAAEEIICAEGMQTVGDRAFADCPSLYMVWMEGEVPEIGTGIFDGSEDVIIVTPSAEIKEWAAEQGFECIMAE